MKLDEKYKENLIRHEIGHWLVAQKLGFSTGDIMIKIMIDNNGNYYHQGSSHINLNPSLNDTKDVCDYIFKRVAILYAGAAFQLISDSRDSNAILDSDGSDDNRKLNELIFVLRGIEYSNDTSQKKELKQRNQITEKCWSKAMEIYEENKESVDAAVKVISLKIQRPHKKYIIKKVELLKLLIE